MKSQFSTKAETLNALRKVIKNAKILPSHVFTVRDWKKDKKACLKSIESNIGKSPWIVRSSSQNEDSIESSNAGAFLSVPSVHLEDLEVSVGKVIDSFGVADGEDQVLIQPMLQGVVRSGVAFSHDPTTCAPYRVINWAEGSDTAVVTGGEGGRVWVQSAKSKKSAPRELRQVLQLTEELLLQFGGSPIDCEFAVTSSEGSDQLWLLQVRPLILKEKPETDEEQEARLLAVESKIGSSSKPNPFLIGQRTIFGVMPDWNPAEIVGVRPKPLALSLYRELITDSIWAYQRHNYGYRNLRSFPLMLHFFGQPFIDVRLSMNSFIPADLNEGLAGRLVEHYMNRLIAEPKLHDKIEFEIVYSCYTLDLPDRLKLLSEFGFSSKDQNAIAQSLRVLTNRVVNPGDGIWKADAAKIEVLNKRREILYSSGAGLLERIYWLIEDGKRYGTLPFAGLARAGFIAVQMLQSLVTVGIFSKSNYEQFMASVSTVSGELSRDRALLNRTSFLQRYGHLRPGTYDILSPRYDEEPDLYFDWETEASTTEESQPFSITLPQMKEIAELLKAHGLDPDPVSLFDFLQAGIEQRELAKFHFTKNLSDVLSSIAEYGEVHGFSREELAFADIQVFKEMYTAASTPSDLIANSIEEGRKRYEQTKKLVLPPLIINSSDVWGFEMPVTEPNFITQRQIRGKVVGCEDLDQLKGAIVCIPSADPGFDWLFSHSIAGLITAWGGANSHMAIRSGELGIPAVIGAGELKYKKWSEAKWLNIDCGNKRVEIIE